MSRQFERKRNLYQAKSSLPRSPRLNCTLNAAGSAQPAASLSPLISHKPATASCADTAPGLLVGLMQVKVQIQTSAPSSLLTLPSAVPIAPRPAFRPRRRAASGSLAPARPRRSWDGDGVGVSGGGPKIDGCASVHRHGFVRDRPCGRGRGGQTPNLKANLGRGSRPVDGQLNSEVAPGSKMHTGRPVQNAARNRGPVALAAGETRR